MLSEELLRKVRLIELTTRKVVDDVLTGNYRSHFKGHGVQFSEHRLYVPGDDIRHIDWRVSARTRDLLVKKYEEERQLTVFLVVDISQSKKFGSINKLKSEIAAEVGGMLAYAASHTGDGVGVLLFAGEVEKIIPPRKGRQHIQRIIAELLTAEPKTRGTDLAGALEAASRIMRHSGIVFVISDFLADDYNISLKKLAHRHDLVAVEISDKKEEAVPKIGHVYFYDAESGEQRFVDTSSYSFQKWFQDFRGEMATDQATALRGSRSEVLRISTEKDYGEAVVKFFKARAKRKGGRR